MRGSLAEAAAVFLPIIIDLHKWNPVLNSVNLHGKILNNDLSIFVGLTAYAADVL